MGGMPVTKIKVKWNFLAIEIKFSPTLKLLPEVLPGLQTIDDMFSTFVINYK